MFSMQRPSAWLPMLLRSISDMLCMGAKQTMIKTSTTHTQSLKVQQSHQQHTAHLLRIMSVLTSALVHVNMVADPQSQNKHWGRRRRTPNHQTHKARACIGSPFGARAPQYNASSFGGHVDLGAWTSDLPRTLPLYNFKLLNGAGPKNANIDWEVFLMFEMFFNPDISIFI